MKKIYHVSVPYISQEFGRIDIGDYGETDIDIVEARQRSYVILINANEIRTHEENLTPKKDVVLGGESNFSLRDLEQTQKIIKIDLLQINKCTEVDLLKLKGVSKRLAEKIIASAPYQDYDDLDKRTPLSMGKKWEDLVAIDFLSDKSVTIENTLLKY